MSEAGARSRGLRHWLPLLLLLAFAWTGTAAAAEPSPDFVRRADELVRLLNAQLPPDRLFSPAFLAQVPAQQVTAISAQLRSSHGPARRVSRIEAATPTTGLVLIAFERAVVRMQMAIDPKPPHPIEGLLVSGAESSAPDVATLLGEIVGLPGDVSLAAARLEESGPADFLTQKADRPMAIGSAFKLFVLAELVRSIRAGERRWSDVVPLGPPSLPSGLLQDWPKGSPLTLHTLAALMISRSDNSATDTLLAVLGREKVEGLLPALGVRAAERNRPLLSTREAFALKLGDPALLARWKSADEGGRRALLPRLAGIEAAKLDPLRLASRPIEIAGVEWFASPSDLVRTLDWLRRNGDSTALDILAIVPGAGSEPARGFSYLGFKGGSEPGVLNLSFLLKTRQGRWIALAATWNNEAAPLDEARFAALMSRLVGLMR
ncbi:MAG TPA: serine hydrolase [Allosphingosinicella sp.]